MFSKSVLHFTKKKVFYKTFIKSNYLKKNIYIYTIAKNMYSPPPILLSLLFMHYLFLFYLPRNKNISCEVYLLIFIFYSVFSVFFLYITLYWTPTAYVPSTRLQFISLQVWVGLFYIKLSATHQMCEFMWAYQIKQLWMSFLGLVCFVWWCRA